jgi:hypothetical protein|tara:strand:- start:471 stop:656 length:186 start_codon:yes stop_codon:yes gene_type:complete
MLNDRQSPRLEIKTARRKWSRRAVLRLLPTLFGSLKFRLCSSNSHPISDRSFGRLRYLVAA